MKLYEFTALLKCSVVVAAKTEEKARAAIETWEKAWIETGDFIGVTDVDLFDVREIDPNCCIEDQAYEIVNA